MPPVARLALLALVPSLTIAPAFAQQEPALPDSDRDTIVTVGIGGAWVPQYDGADRSRFTPVPGAVGMIAGYRFLYLGNQASVDLLAYHPDAHWDFQAGPLGLVNFDRTSTGNISDPQVQALGQRSTAIELGGYASIGRVGVLTRDYDRLSLSLSYRHDVVGANGSMVVQPALTYMTPLSRKTAVGFYVSAEYVGDGYASYYYSVSPEQSAVSGLPIYTARGGWKDWTLGVFGGVSLTGDLYHGFKLIGGVTRRQLLGSIADSPVVAIAGSRNQWITALGLGYTF